MTITLKARVKRPFARTAAIYRWLTAVRKFEITEGNYTVRLARTPREVRSALELRYRVFKVEMQGDTADQGGPKLDMDAYDLRSRHLVVVDNRTGEAVGTYRMNTIETARNLKGFYSFGEFSIEDLPPGVIEKGVEAGRACVAREHRNTKVLFLLFKGLAAYVRLMGKRYLFGCCSIFDEDPEMAAAVYRQLCAEGNMHPRFFVRPRNSSIAVDIKAPVTERGIALPALFNMYLRFGAKVCSGPIIDRDFHTTDLFVVLDLHAMEPRYRKMFFGS